jgi:predicted nucleotidyltransferase
VSVELLELGASALDELLDEVVFVGGATVVLWISDPAAPPPRPTKDVDVIVEIASRRSYYQFEKRLRSIGFKDEGTVICRWIHRDTGLILDAMPTDATLLGFNNHWQAESFPWAVERTLPSGAQIKAIPPPFLLATKLEAFLDRGEGDLIASRDFEDIVNLIDGREELVDEIAAAPPELREYVAAELTKLLNHERILDGLSAQLLPDATSQERAKAVVLPRMRQIANAPAAD